MTAAALLMGILFVGLFALLAATTLLERLLGSSEFNRRARQARELGAIATVVDSVHLTASPRP